MYFGYEFHILAEKIDKEELTDVKERCKSFLIILANEIKKRLPANLATMKIISNLHPKIATSQIKPDIKDVLMQFNRVNIYGIKNETEAEWNQLQNKEWKNVTNSVEFYSEVYDDTDAAGHKRFENISKFAIALLSLPFSNASVERSFSMLNIVKNKLRNKLSVDMLQSIMMVRSTLQRIHGSCTNFNPSPNMLKLFTVEMYDFKTSGNSNEEIENDELFEAFDNIL